MDNYFIFEDRQHAGEELGLLLEPKYKHLHPLVLGIPRGGIEVAYYVARRLHAELSLVVSKKLPLPRQPEYGIGAVAEEYSVYVSPEGKQLLPPKALNQIIEEQIQEVNRRVKRYRHGKLLPEMKDRTVILVDDGIATGVTLVPLIKLCRKKEVAQIIIAAPVSGTRYNKILNEADAIEILVQPLFFYAVGQVYKDFEECDDTQIMKLVQRAEEEQKGITSKKE